MSTPEQFTQWLEEHPDAILLVATNVWRKTQRTAEEKGIDPRTLYTGVLGGYDIRHCPSLEDGTIVGVAPEFFNEYMLDLDNQTTLSVCSQSIVDCFTAIGH